MELYTALLVVASVIAVAVTVVGQSSGRSRGRKGWLTTQAILGGAAFSVLMSTLAYAMAGAADANLVSLIIGDITMPLAPALLWAAMRRANGRRRTLIPFALAGSLTVGACTLIGGPEFGQIIKLHALGVFGLLVFLETVRGRIRRTAGARILGIAALLYGLYSFGRLIGAAFLAEGSPVLQWYLDTAPSAVGGALTVVAVATGAALLVRQTSKDRPVVRVLTSAAFARRAGAMLTGPEPAIIRSLCLPTLPLHRAAYGGSWSRTLDQALQETALELLPTSSVLGTAGPGILFAAIPPTSEQLLECSDEVEETFARNLPAWARPEAIDVRVETWDVTDTAELSRALQRSRMTQRKEGSLWTA